MTASDNGAFRDGLSEGYLAVTHTNSCLVFQLNNDEKSKTCQRVRAQNRVLYPPASRSNLICAYSSLFDE